MNLRSPQFAAVAGRRLGQAIEVPLQRLGRRPLTGRPRRAEADIDRTPWVTEEEIAGPGPSAPGARARLPELPRPTCRDRVRRRGGRLDEPGCDTLDLGFDREAMHGRVRGGTTSPMVEEAIEEGAGLSSSTDLYVSVTPAACETYDDSFVRPGVRRARPQTAGPVGDGQHVEMSGSATLVGDHRWSLMTDRSCSRGAGRLAGTR